MDQPDKNIVNSLAKGFRVLEAFTSEEPELVLAEVARRANLDNATTFRMLNTLVMLGYLQKVEDSRKFRLTLKCLDLGFNAIARSDLRTQARPILRSLVGEVNEAASIGVLEGTEVVYIERMQAGMTRLGVDVRVGSRAPVHSTAIGHAIVGFLPRAEQERILRAAPRKKMTERTVTDINRLLRGRGRGRPRPRPQGLRASDRGAGVAGRRRLVRLARARRLHGSPRGRAAARPDARPALLGRGQGGRGRDPARQVEDEELRGRVLLGGYHGKTVGAMALTTGDPRRGFGPLVVGNHSLPYPDPYRPAFPGDPKDLGATSSDSAASSSSRRARARSRP